MPDPVAESGSSGSEPRVRAGDRSAAVLRQALNGAIVEKNTGRRWDFPAAARIFLLHLR